MAETMPSPIDLLRPQHRVRLGAVAGEHGGGGLPGPLVHDEGEVLAAAGLQSAGHSGRGESLRVRSTLTARLRSR